MPTLYIVATPIGNLEDITLRAIRVLTEVDFILCEDTRTTKNLLNKYEIKTPTISYHSKSGEAKRDKIVDLLENGKNLALVSDAGTPCISDPGVYLIRELYEYFSDGISIIPIPGPSAPVTALSGSGVPASEYLFLGFLPQKKGRQKILSEIAIQKRTVVFFESKHRIMKLLGELSIVMPDRIVVIARELTKIHEEYLRDTPLNLMRFFSENPEKTKGEFVVIVGGK